MPITYPLTAPLSPKPRAMDLRGRAVVAHGRSPFTGDGDVQVHAGQWWEIEITLPPMDRAEAEAWNTFLLKLNGKEGTFLIGDRSSDTPRGSAGGTPLVAGASQTGNDLNTDGWPVSITGVLLAGDYIQLGTGATARLYKLLDNADSDVAGAATLTLWPEITTATSPADNAAIVTSSAVGLFRLASNEMPWAVNEALHYAVTLAAISEV